MGKGGIILHILQLSLGFLPRAIVTFVLILAVEHFSYPSHSPRPSLPIRVIGFNGCCWTRRSFPPRGRPFLYGVENILIQTLALGSSGTRLWGCAVLVRCLIIYTNAYRIGIFPSALQCRRWTRLAWSTVTRSHRLSAIGATTRCWARL